MTALALALVTPWAAGIVLALLDGRRRLVGWLAVAAIAANLAALVVLAADVLRDGPVEGSHGRLAGGRRDHAARGRARRALRGALVAALLAATAHEVLDGVRERVFPGLVVLLAPG